MWEGAVYGAVFLGSALVCLLRGVLHVHRRPVSLALGVGMSLYAGGTIYYALFLATRSTIP